MTPHDPVPRDDRARSSTTTSLSVSGIDHVLIRPWRDIVMEQVGYDPRSAYAEKFWLGVLGPSNSQ